MPMRVRGATPQDVEPRLIPVGHCHRDNQRFAGFRRKEITGATRRMCIRPDESERTKVGCSLKRFLDIRLVLRVIARSDIRYCVERWQISGLGIAQATRSLEGSCEFFESSVFVPEAR